MAYSRFFLMVAVSTVLVFGLMYLNTYLFGHIFWSETRTFMAIVMGAVMAFVMLAFMFGMYKNRTLNIVVFVGAIIVFAGALWLVRSQLMVQDRAYMRAMIPHHSIAIMTSSRAEITDPNDTALVKISGDLIGFDREGASFTADPITIQVRDTENDSVLDLVISAVSRYEAGFRGQYNSTN